ncbi:MAG: phosphoribosylanthranilate isomerase [Oscillospiraceae bacterium]|nr:phosphoribosylanthranilate isomerase [Oscillospiraceae bacterium]MBQ9109914.1 phosphoribosylanthranilate isomerase [Oscillospiraceae bacterium]
MTKIKLCGLTRESDIFYANVLAPEYVGFIFAQKSRRYIPPEKAEILRKKLNASITPVGVFVDEEPECIADLVDRNIIGIVQLHGNEDEVYIRHLRKLTQAKIIKAFQITSKADIIAANASTADYVLLDSGGGSGELFDHALIKGIARPYFLAGGLTPQNVRAAVEKFHPFAVDASSSLETDGFKDKTKMTAFVRAVRERMD